mmetsp:Transcript_13689/g.32412  ORF Transcript_13689/g.32412 Transcript_13689/m.32412 type:complete len:1032 (+) Transcript_13689:159-3254(+)
MDARQGASRDSVLSEESVMSMSNKLLSMESELDKTLREIDQPSRRSQTHSRSPMGYRISSSSGGLRRSGSSLDPLASSRRSESIDPTLRGDADQRVRELAERLENAERDSQLLETKYQQQRKRLNLAKRENDELRNTLDSAISEINKLGEEAKEAHKNRADSAALGAADTNVAELKASVASLEDMLKTAHAEIAQLRDEAGALRLGEATHERRAEQLEETVQRLRAQLKDTVPKDGLSHICSGQTFLVVSVAELEHGMREGLRLAVAAQLGPVERSTWAARQVGAVVDDHLALPLTQSSTPHPREVVLTLVELGAEGSSRSPVPLASAVIPLPEGKFDSSSGVANSCLQLDEWVTFLPSANGQSPGQSPGQSKALISLAALNVGRLAGDLAGLEIYKRHFPEVVSQAESAHLLRAEVESLRASLDAIQPPEARSFAPKESPCVSPELDHPLTSELEGEPKPTNLTDLLQMTTAYSRKRPLTAFLGFALACCLAYLFFLETIHAMQLNRVLSSSKAVQADFDGSWAALGRRVGRPGMLQVHVGAVVSEAANCSARVGAFETNASAWLRCSRDLASERQVTAQLLGELNLGADKKGSPDSKGASNSGWFTAAKSTASSASASAGAGESAKTAASLLQCRREHSAEAALRVDAVVGKESAEQRLHECEQDLSRVGSAKSSSEAERSTCEERLIKQESWAASLSATNKVLHDHLREANEKLGAVSRAHLETSEAAAKCEAEYEALATARDSATATVSLLSTKAADLENSTASLASARGILEKDLEAATKANEKLSAEKDSLRSEREAAVKASDGLKREKASLEKSHAAAASQVKELDRALKELEKKARASVLGLASAESSSRLLEERSMAESSKAKKALAEKEAMEIRLKALGAEASLCASKRAELQGEVDAKAKRLFDLERAVASLGAVESVVNKEHHKVGSASIEHCNSGASSQGSDLCLKVETRAPSLTSRAASAAAGLARSAARKATLGYADWSPELDAKEETPGLVAIAGAVAAVWVFVVVMEKRRALYQ